jgi:Xaa-Pro aminopeptidase
MAKAQDLKRGSSGGERIEALQASMNEHGVDLVIVRPTTNMRYLTGYGGDGCGADHGPPRDPRSRRDGHAVLRRRRIQGRNG